MPTPKPTTFDALLKQLNAENATRRFDAMEAVRQLDADELTRLAKQAAQSYPWSWRRYVLGSPQFWCILGLPIAFFLMSLVSKVFSFDTETVGRWILYSGGGLVLFSFFHYLHTEPARLYDNLRRAVSEKPEAAPLGLLLELHRWETLPAMTAPKNMSKQILVPAIEQKLKSLQSENYADLTIQQRQTLLAFLRSPLDHIVLAFALLNVLKTVGDQRAVSVVKKLAAFKHPSQVAEQIRRAAQECLDAMQAEHDGEQTARVLLRAADESATGRPDTLLRPAGSTAGTAAPEQLLRASDE